MFCNKSEPRVAQRGLVHQIKRGVAGPNPYIFLTVPKGRSQSLIQGFEVIEENDNKKAPVDEENDEKNETDNDDEDGDVTKDSEDYDDDNDQQLDDIAEEEEDKYSVGNNADEEEDDELDNVMSMNLKLRKSNPKTKNAKTTQMMVSRDNAGAILVPDEIIEIEGQSVIDEKTGKPALLLPRAILDSIPDGSVVALMERSVEDEDEAEERANRVIVRRRRKGALVNIKRRRGGNKNYVVRRSSNKRRPVNKRKNVRVVRRGNRGGSRRGVNKRRINRRRVFLQD